MPLFVAALAAEVAPRRSGKGPPWAGSFSL